MYKFLAVIIGKDRLEVLICFWIDQILLLKDLSIILIYMMLTFQLGRFRVPIDAIFRCGRICKQSPHPLVLLNQVIDKLSISLPVCLHLRYCVFELGIGVLDRCDFVLLEFVF